MNPARVYFEIYVENPVFIHVQVLADYEKNCIHLFDRVSVVEVKGEKVVELAPTPLLDGNIRQKMLDNAIELMKAVNYQSVGTVEFLLDRSGNYYFTKIKPGIQLESTVTEEVSIFALTIIDFSNVV